ncbi:MAG: GWxTD domain-containing protein [Saprospiraceae bacterium]|nr:GWxTD domain-containing protein [Saprospiraceae bacterium]
MKYAYAVDKTYRSQVGYGFETDRGYIYLKYGMPTDLVTRESEPTAPPYEIWFYDHIDQGKQKNVRFIFYIPSLAHNDYELLHSTCIGEKNNPKWFYDLYSKRNDSSIVNMQPAQIQEFYNSLRNSFDNNAVKIWEEFK